MLLNELLAPPSEPTPAARILTPHDVGGDAAWQLLIRDGAVSPLFGDTGLPVNIPVTPTWRAKSLANIVPSNRNLTRPTAVAGLTAAWVWLGGPAPAQLELIHALGQVRQDTPEVKARASAFTSFQVAQLAGVWVTTPARTIRDLALWHPQQVALPAIVNLVAAGAKLSTALYDLNQPRRLNGRPQARDTLAAAAVALAA